MTPADQAGLDPPQLSMLLCGMSITLAELAAPEMVRLKQHLSNHPTKCLGRGVSSRSHSFPWHQGIVLTFSEKQNNRCPAALILPFPFKPRSKSYSHSAKLVFHQAPIKKVILVTLKLLLK